MSDVQNALTAGRTLAAGEAGLQADAAKQELELLMIRNQIEGYEADLKRLTGLPDSVRIVPDTTIGTSFPAELPPLEQYVREAGAGNADLRTARSIKEKARSGVRAAYKDYLPDLGIVTGYSFQHGIDYYPQDDVYAGVLVTWNLFDGGGRQFTLRKREVQEKEADEHLADVDRQVPDDVEKAYRAVQRTGEMIHVAEKALEYRRKDREIQENKRAAGSGLEAERLAAPAAFVQAEVDLLSAEANCRITMTDLELLIGAGRGSRP